jgi:hypothetical protein
MGITATNAVNITFENICYNIEVGTKKEPKTKRVLRNLSGVLRAGTMTAIMGFSLHTYIECTHMFSRTSNFAIVAAQYAYMHTYIKFRLPFPYFSFHSISRYFYKFKLNSPTGSGKTSLLNVLANRMPLNK